MSKSKSFWHKRVDGFIVLMAFFALVLVGLFVYLEKIAIDIRHYRSYQHKLHKMVVFEKDLENLFLQKFRYVDYDETERLFRACESELRYFKQSELSREFGERSYQELLDIQRLYRKKRDLIGRFQSANARATNAIHYLYDLRNTIKKKYPLDIEKNRVMDQFFFFFGKILMDLPPDRKLFEKSLAELEKESSQHKLLYYFYSQTKQFMADVLLIQKIVDENRKIKVIEAIETLSADLLQQYERNLLQQKVITFSFFAMAFMILLLLFYQYWRMRRTSLELKAFRYAIENSDNSVVITDAQRHILYANEAFEQHSGYKIDEVLGHNPNVLKSNMHSDTFYKELNETLDRGEKWQGELINKRKDGSLLYEKASIVPIVVNGELEQYLAIKLDITEYIEQQKKLQQAAVAFESIGEGIMIMDSQKKIIIVNPATKQIFGYTEEELLGREPLLLSGKDEAALYRKIWDAVEVKGKWAGRVEGKRKSGKRIPAWLTIKAVKNQEDDTQNFVAILTNLEEILEMKERVSFLAYHDNLTKLPNRAYVEKELVEIFDLARVLKKWVAFLFIDLDRFKVINDTLGHNVGDQMLTVLAGRLQNVVRKSDLLARFGGDEFVVVMDDIADREEAGRVAAEIQQALREPIKVRDYHLNTTVSIGIAIYPEDGEDINVIIKHADVAMYHAKERGKDNYQFYSNKLSIDMHIRLDLEQKLIHAIENNEFSLVYQPQYDLRSKRICGAEALLRWDSPELGRVSPAQFIPVAEETGAIVAIGYFVLREAARTYLHWKEHGVALDWIAINLSSIQFQQEDLLENYSRIINETGISAENLELEITERCIMEYTQENLSILNGFRKMGCRISIDDFGTGYSSMGYLKDFSMDSIKIDKSFIDHLPKNSNNSEVTTAIIALSHSLEYTVIAEGIENREQEAFLIAQGCDYGQGYYFSRPLDRDALIEFVKAKSEQ